MAEQLTVNQLVVGSSPTLGAKRKIMNKYDILAVLVAIFGYAGFCYLCYVKYGKK